MMALVGARKTGRDGEGCLETRREYIPVGFSSAPCLREFPNTLLRLGLSATLQCTW